MAKKKDKGWIKLHRQIVDSFVWKTPEPFDKRSAWIDLIMMANHEQRTIPLRSGASVTVNAGQFFTSMDHLADRWHWSRGKVIRYLAWLSGQGMVNTSGTTNGTTVTIIKYGLFQNGGTTTGTANGTTDGTTGGTTDGTRTRTNIQELSNKNVNKKTRERAPGSYSEEDFE